MKATPPGTGSTSPSPSIPSSSPPPDPATERADRVAACVSAHGMRTARDHQANSTESRRRFRFCTWPPAAGADPDGYAEIEVTSEQGPGRWLDDHQDTSEASGASVRDRITGTCTTFELTYDYGHMGSLKHLPPFTVPVGTVTSVDAPGRPWKPAPDDPRGWTFYPSRTEVSVIRTDSYGLDQARCV